MIRLENVTKSYSEDVVALRDASDRRERLHRAGALEDTRQPVVVLG